MAKIMQRPHIEMTPTLDRDGVTYYIGKLRFPGTLNFEKGMAFLFYPEGDYPELHFCSLDSPDLSDVFDYYKTRRTRITRAHHSNLPIELHKRYEKNPEPGTKPRVFYIGKIQFNGQIVCDNGVIFFVFIADEGQEELQIGTYDIEKAGKKDTPYPQTYTRRSTE